MESLAKTKLEKILDYRNENIICRFTDMFNVEEGEAEEILKETLKFLYISNIPGVFIPDDLLILDEMWHNMILFTPEYHKLTQEHFNRYLHHVPAKKAEKESRKLLLAQDHAKAKQEYLKKLEILISVTYDQLGEETVIKWFQEYPVKYSKEKIKALRK